MANERSGQITVATSGTAVQGDYQNGSMFAIVAHPSNTGNIWVGNDGDDVSTSSGFPLVAKSSPIVVVASNLSDFWFDADVDGEKACWIQLS